MRPWWVLLGVSWCWACNEAPKPPPPPRVAPAPKPKPLPPVLPPAPDPLDEAPESIAAFPDEPDERDVSTDGRLLELLLADPDAAEAALAHLATPDAWRVSLSAQFALAHGAKSRALEEEPALPLATLDGGAVVVGAPAWVMDDVPLVGPGKKPKTLQRLPINTEVQVLAVEGERARVSVGVAQVAVWGPSGLEPVQRTTKQLGGTVPLGVLAPRALEVDALIQRAMEQKEDAVALWQRAWRVERSARTREGLLRAGWAAQRASTVVSAALSRDFAAVRELSFAWTCTGEAPPTKKWLDVSKARPKSVPTGVCLEGVDARVQCERHGEEAMRDAKARAAWLEKQQLTAHPWVRFIVDARERRQVFLVATPLELVDTCDDFEQVTFEAGSGLVRRLVLPLGAKDLEVWVPVTRAQGVEYAVPSARAEGQAVRWLRARGKYKWTVGTGGELQPSLSTDATTFAVPADVSASTIALPPQRVCECQRQE